VLVERTSDKKDQCTEIDTALVDEEEESSQAGKLVIIAISTRH